MSDWLHGLPILWMTMVVFGLVYVLAGAIQLVIRLLAGGNGARSFAAISPGMLPPLGLVFGLFVVFTAAQVWSDNDRATAVVNREASALRAVVVLAGIFPGEPEARLRNLVRQYIQETAAQEWPQMARRSASLKVTPPPLAEALQSTLALAPSSAGQQSTQHEIVAALQTALDARRQRIIISQSQVNFVKWLCLFIQAVCALVAIAMVHSGNQLSSIIAMGIFATGIEGQADEGRNPTHQ
jgi:hypothetical protein